jgi:2-oxoglutarate ferredoxin oxidoreductase subunit delta
MADKKKLDFRLDRTLCKSCGICWGLCPRGVLAPDGEGMPEVKDPDACVLCRLCEYRCPDFAIRAEGV